MHGTNNDCLIEGEITQLSYRYLDDVDLMAIEGVSHVTGLTLMSELRNEDIKNFQHTSTYVNTAGWHQNKEVRWYGY